MWRKYVLQQKNIYFVDTPLSTEATPRRIDAKNETNEWAVSEGYISKAIIQCQCELLRRDHWALDNGLANCN